MKKLFLTLAALSGFFIVQNVQATCSNYTSYTDGTVLTASSLNSLQTNYTNCVNGVLDGDTFTGNMLWYSGADILLYSDTGSTLNAAIYGDSGEALLGLREVGDTNGLNLSLSAGTLTVQCNGSACSASNPGYATSPSTTAGTYKVLKVTASGSFIDASGSSNLTHEGWGVTEATNWAQDVPFFLYVVNRSNSAIDGADGSSAFFIARSPWLTTTPSSANNIGDTGAIASSESQNNILILDDVTVANYTSLPVQLIGAFRMRWASGTTDWTVQTLGTTDGIGKPQLDKTFLTAWTMPTGQNGAASGTFLLDNSGTAPVFTTNSYKYKLGREGIITIEAYLNGDGGTDGAGAVNAQLSVPLIPSPFTASARYYMPMGVATGATTITGGALVMGLVIDGNNYLTLSYQSAATTTANITNAMFSNGARDLQIRATYSN